MIINKLYIYIYKIKNFIKKTLVLEPFSVFSHSSHVELLQKEKFRSPKYHNQLVNMMINP